jgi:hypothetical protein
MERDACSRFTGPNSDYVINLWSPKTLGVILIATCFVNYAFNNWTDCANLVVGDLEADNQGNSTLASDLLQPL